MLNKLRVGVAGLLLVSAGALVQAKTPDGETPAVETICDVFQGSEGGAFGLCNAYCEAMDCGDPLQHSANQACSRVNDNFQKKFGMRLPEGYNYDSNFDLVNNCEISPDPDPDPDPDPVDP